MTIGRKLYTGFGSILGILILLFVVSFIASHIEHTRETPHASHCKAFKASNYSVSK